MTEEEEERSGLTFHSTSSISQQSFNYNRDSASIHRLSWPTQLARDPSYCDSAGSQVGSSWKVVNDEQQYRSAGMCANLELARGYLIAWVKVTAYHPTTSLVFSPTYRRIFIYTHTPLLACAPIELAPPASRFRFEMARVVATFQPRVYTACPVTSSSRRALGASLSNVRLKEASSQPLGWS